MSPAPSDHWCAYSEVVCTKAKSRCRPKERCRRGYQLYEDKYTGGFHHHAKEGQANEPRQPAR